MYKKRITADNEILTMLHGSESERDAAIKEILFDESLNQTIQKMLTRYGAEDFEREEICEDAIISFYENVCKGKFDGKSAINTYITSIAKFKWFNYLKKKKRELPRESMEEIGGSEEMDFGVSEDAASKLWELLKELKPPCPQVIRMWAESYSMKQIMAQFGYANEQGAKNRVHRCRKFLKELIAGHSYFNDYSI